MPLAYRSTPLVLARIDYSRMKFMIFGYGRVEVPCFYGVLGVRASVCVRKHFSKHHTSLGIHLLSGIIIVPYPTWDVAI